MMPAEIQVMENALIDFDGEMFELEDVDNAGDHTHVILTPNGTAILFEYVDNASQRSVPLIRIFEKDDTGRDNPLRRRGFGGLVSAIDLMWSSRKDSWLQYPQHVALAKKLAELCPDTQWAEIIREGLAEIE